MEYQELLGLIDKLDQSSVSYVNYSHSGDSVELAKKVPERPGNQTEASTVSTSDSVNVQTTNESAAGNPIAENEEPAQSSKDEAVESPMVGVVYLQSSPEEAPYVSVGDHVEEGDDVVLVEAMKLMTEIKADMSGIITEVSVDNGEVVEYGQPLVRIKRD